MYRLIKVNTSLLNILSKYKYNKSNLRQSEEKYNVCHIFSFGLEIIASRAVKLNIHIKLIEVAWQID